MRNAKRCGCSFSQSNATFAGERIRVNNQNSCGCGCRNNHCQETFRPRPCPPRPCPPRPCPPRPCPSCEDRCASQYRNCMRNCRWEKDDDCGCRDYEDRCRPDFSPCEPDRCDCRHHDHGWDNCWNDDFYDNDRPCDDMDDHKPCHKCDANE